MSRRVTGTRYYAGTVYSLVSLPGKPATSSTRTKVILSLSLFAFALSGKWKEYKVVLGSRLRSRIDSSNFTSYSPSSPWYVCLITLITTEVCVEGSMPADPLPPQVDSLEEVFMDGPTTD